MLEQKQIIISYTDYSSEKELNGTHQSLLKKAKQMSEDAYAPYSDFKVGAAVLLANGQEIGGSNQENRAFPSGLCAERVALFSSGANFPNQSIQAIAVYAEKGNEISPCGACRQVMLEYQQKQEQPIQVLLMNQAGEVRHFESVSQLLPFGFIFDKFLSK